MPGNGRRNIWQPTLVCMCGERRDPTLCQIIGDSVVEFWRTGGIGRVAGRHIDHHALASTGQQHAISIGQIGLAYRIAHYLPFRATEMVMRPSIFMSPEICLPTNTDPIQRESLDI